MKRKCAWCGQDLGNSIPLDGKGVTHGICLSCSEKMLAESRLAFVRENLFQDDEMSEPFLSAGVERLFEHGISGLQFSIRQDKFL